LETVDLVIKNAAQLLIPKKDNARATLKIISDGAVACSGERIVATGKTADVIASIKNSKATRVIDASGMVVAPGFVDPHTHPVFFGSREHEFHLRNSGKSYTEIAEAGGGIRCSVRQLRRASKQQLIQHCLPHLDHFIENGTTTIEAKSGYGLTLDDEIKSLEVIHELNRLHPIDLVATFLGAHEIPDEYRSRHEDYVRLVIEEMIPRVAELQLAEFCDVFCESHVFNSDQSERILTAAKQYGFKVKIHADQLTSGGGAALAAKLKAVSADHLDHINDQAIQQLKNAGTIPVLLPGAVFFLGLTQYAPARKLLDAGLPVALATDFNPGSCMTESLPMMMTLASIYLKMTSEEVWCATTIHAAQAIARPGKIGTLENGALADIVIWNIPNYQYLPYHFGVNLVNCVLKRGKIVREKN